MNVDWSVLETFVDVNEAVQYFYSKINAVLDIHVPLYKTYKRRYPKWYTSEIINNIRQKSKHFEKYKKHKSMQHFQEYKRLRALIKQQIENAYENYLLNVQASIKTDSKNFWAFIQ